ncbi:ATP-grasp domain-containing protein [Actinophytocola xanthii]|uniref:ATP-grasp domain-containing protein n=1 Tax=Actinophytocola xanthii TaxID=1912961 RepID=A0A1Q8CK32_9PSEU|nr:ATP-grasp domain-containing protein [Actinophytocola xanthii]OLF14683.1 hypothetical protein BU204_25670 [Actinophytocola xanthii]
MSSTEGRTVLVIGIVENREFAIRTLLRAGVRLLLVDFVDAPHLRLADRYRGVGDLFDERQVRSAVADVLGADRPDAVMTFFDECMVLTATLAAEFGIPFMSADAARAATVKSVQRTVLAEAGVPQPRFRICHELDEVRAAVEELGFPVCVKPVDQAGSIGVGLAGSAEELGEITRRAWHSRLRANAPLLVEEQVRGQEISVEALTCDGETTVLCQVRKEVVAGESPIVNGHALPYQHAHAEAAEAAVRTGLAALGVDRCFSNTELIITESGPKVVEINARTPGDVIMDMIWHCSGFNPYLAALDMALGATPSVSLEWTHHEAMRFLCGKEGTLTGLRGIEQAAAVDGAVEVRLAATVGTRLREPRDNMDHVAFVVARAPALSDALARVTEMTNHLAVATTDGSH